MVIDQGWANLLTGGAALGSKISQKGPEQQLQQKDGVFLVNPPHGFCRKPVC